MIQSLADIAALSPEHLGYAIGAAFVAGMVRGFSGFGLSAVIMASLVVFIPPLYLVPLCFVLEAVAGLMMVRGGIRDANNRVAFILAASSAIAMPLSLYFTVTVDPDLSRMVALFLIIALTLAQLFRISPDFLRAPSGVYIAGGVAGIASGLASVGGMVIALYVLAQNEAARQMRGSLVMFLFITLLSSFITHLLFGTLDWQVMGRAMVLAPFLVLGVLIGTWLFRPALEQYYKLFCLLLLLTLSLIGLIQLV